jgi:hypothetical protein
MSQYNQNRLNELQAELQKEPLPTAASVKKHREEFLDERERQAQLNEQLRTQRESVQFYRPERREQLLAPIQDEIAECNERLIAAKHQYDRDVARGGLAIEQTAYAQQATREAEEKKQAEEESVRRALRQELADDLKKRYLASGGTPSEFEYHKDALLAQEIARRVAAPEQDAMTPKLKGRYESMS